MTSNFTSQEGQESSSQENSSPREEKSSPKTQSTKPIEPLKTSHDVNENNEHVAPITLVEEVVEAPVSGVKTSSTLNTSSRSSTASGSPPCSPSPATGSKVEENEMSGSNSTTGSESSRSMEPNCKVFLGGLSWVTTEASLRSHFAKYGEIGDAVVMRNRTTNRSRGFGFISFTTSSAVEAVLSDSHVIDNRAIECKPAIPRDQIAPGVSLASSNHQLSTSSYIHSGKSSSSSITNTTSGRNGPGTNGSSGSLSTRSLSASTTAAAASSSATTTSIASHQHQLQLHHHNQHHLYRPIANKLKLYVGGVPVSVSESEFREYFASFGPVSDIAYIRDRGTGVFRGYGFVTYIMPATVDAVLSRHHKLGDSIVTVRIAEKKPSADNSSVSSTSSSSLSHTRSANSVSSPQIIGGVPPPSAQFPIQHQPLVPPHQNMGHFLMQNPQAMAAYAYPPMMNPFLAQPQFNPAMAAATAAAAAAAAVAANGSGTQQTQAQQTYQGGAGMFPPSAYLQQFPAAAQAQLMATQQQQQQQAYQNFLLAASGNPQYAQLPQQVPQTQQQHPTRTQGEGSWSTDGGTAQADKANMAAFVAMQQQQQLAAYAQAHVQAQMAALSLQHSQNTQSAASRPESSTDDPAAGSPETPASNPASD